MLRKQSLHREHPVNKTNSTLSSYNGLMHQPLGKIFKSH
jgi:hypothetical protein